MRLDTVIEESQYSKYDSPSPSQLEGGNFDHLTEYSSMKSFSENNYDGDNDFNKLIKVSNEQG